MQITVRCPNKDCGQTYSVDSSKIGAEVTCKRCGRPFELAAETIDPSTDETHPTPTKSAESAKPKAQKLGRFEVRQRVGSGAFGDVYRAYDPTLERDVALKVPRSGVVLSEQARARFLREPKAAAKLQHPHIVPVFETGSVGKHLYIASAFIDGDTLDNKIGEAGLDFRQAAQIVHDLADALHNAHHKGIVHRDVKSSNVMIDSSGQAMLMDFGLARMDYVEEHLTQEGSVTGTPAYMSPEQAGQGADKAGPPSDQYSLGVVLYELLCGQRPFQGSLMEVMRDILNREPTPPRQINPTVPLDLETICLRAMSKEPEHRYEDCRAMADDLARWLDDMPIVARPIGHAERITRWCRRNPILAGVSLAAVALIVLSGLAFSALFSSSSQRDVAQTKRQQAESRLEQAESDLERLKHELAQTRQELTAAKEALVGATTDEERSAAQARVDSAEEQLAALEKELAEPVPEELLPHVPPAAEPKVEPRTPAKPDPKVPKPNRPISPAPTVAPFDAVTARSHQDAWARYLAVPVEEKIDLGGEELSMVLIPPGEFLMGSSAEQQARFLEAARTAGDEFAAERIPAEGPQHRVQITRPFRLARHEVTVGQFRRFVEQTEYKTEAERSGKGGHRNVNGKWLQDPRLVWHVDPGFPQTEHHPVVNVSWNDATAFCHWLSEKQGTEYLLPSESQWEYACRAGTATAWYSGDNERTLAKYAWFAKNSRARAHPVAKLEPNAWGLYDMHGNVWEWCADAWAADYYAQSPFDDPRGSTSGTRHILRGGHWALDASRCRSANRSHSAPDYRHNGLGFRVLSVLADK